MMVWCAVIPPVALIILWPGEHFTWKHRLAAIAGVCLTMGLVALFGSGSDMPWGRTGDYRP